MLEHAQPVMTGLRQVAGAFLDLLPNLLTAVVLLAIGYLAARILRAFTLRSARTLNRGAQAIGLGGLVRSAGVQGSAAQVLASIIY